MEFLHSFNIHKKTVLVSFSHTPCFCSICIFSTFHFHNPHNGLFFSLKLNLCRKEIIKLKNKKSVVSGRRKKIQKTSEAKNLLFEMTSKIDKPLCRLCKWEPHLSPLLSQHFLTLWYF